MAEIILIGTFHYPGRYDIFSDDVQKQIDAFTQRLASLHPNKIAVEFPYRMQNELDKLYELSNKYSFEENIVYGNIERYGSITSFKSVNEIVQIGFRLGKKLNHDKIYGIDEDIELSDKLYGKIAPYIDMDTFFAKEQKMAENVQDIMGSYVLHNSDAYIRLDHSIYLDINRINMGKYEGSQLVLQWYERNLKLFSNLQNICEKGDRVLVLIGSAHLKILKELITACNELKLCDGI